MAALDTARSPRSLARFSHGLHYLRSGPFARCAYDLHVLPGKFCVEIDTGTGTPEPYVVRWDSLSQKGEITVEGWEIVFDSALDAMTERQVGPEVVGWMRPFRKDGQKYLDVVLHGDSIRMVPGENFNPLINRRFIAGIWTPKSPDSTRPFTFLENGELGGFRYDDLYQLTPEQKADTIGYGGRSYRLVSGPGQEEHLLPQNSPFESLPSLRWTRRHDTLRLATIPDSGEHPDSITWCDLVRKSDAPMPDEDNPRLERNTFDSLFQAAFLPATIQLDPVFKCLLDLEVTRLKTPEVLHPTAAHRIAQSRAACLGSPIGNVADSGQVLWARDSTWTMESKWDASVFTTIWRLKGPPRFRFMTWERKDAAFRTAFRFLEPKRGATWLERHENSQYRFSTKNQSCSLSAGFGEWITLTTRCADSTSPAKPSKTQRKEVR